MEKINILLVEDDPIIAADLQDRLESIGYDVLGPVASGEHALDFFESASPDLVIMDIQLEGAWDGIETSRRILARQAVPIVFLTSNSDDATFRKAREVNPSAFLSKPFRGRDLIHAIELAIRQTARQSEKNTSADMEDNSFLLNDRLFVKVKDRMIRLFFHEIYWVEADDYYCKVHTADKEYLVTKTLKKFSEDLKGRQEFLRVHRSCMVNLNHVEEIGELHLHIGKYKIPLSRNVREDLMNKLKRI